MNLENLSFSSVPEITLNDIQIDGYDVSEVTKDGKALSSVVALRESAHYFDTFDNIIDKVTYLKHMEDAGEKGPWFIGAKLAFDVEGAKFFLWEQSGKAIAFATIKTIQILPTKDYVLWIPWFYTQVNDIDFIKPFLERIKAFVESRKLLNVRIRFAPHNMIGFDLIKSTGQMHRETTEVDWFIGRELPNA